MIGAGASCCHPGLARPLFVGSISHLVKSIPQSLEEDVDQRLVADPERLKAERLARVAARSEGEGEVLIDAGMAFFGSARSLKR
jgi:hypothetical protein